MNELVIFLVLLLVSLESSGKVSPEKYEIFDELENLDMGDEGDDEFDLLEWSSQESPHASKNLVNVETFGAVGDGVSDDTKAFVKAWTIACTTPRSILLVPEGGRFLVNATRFNGPCAGKLVVQIDGSIVAPSNPDVWDSNNLQTWIVFNNLNKVSFHGKGTVHGSGQEWWARSCKRDKSKLCKPAPTALTIDSSSNVRIKGLTIRDGQQMNLIIGRCNSVRVLDVTVTAPGNSPNTDGIHITGSTNVVLQKCKIGTGDDCVSIVSGSSDIKLKDITCGPGHGISIGSLGKNNSTGTVEKVVLDTAFIKNTDNGLRIKTWQGGSGFVKGVRFQNVVMEDVSNPIIIDQFYCDSPTSCPNQTSAVAISEIMYLNITGTSNTKKAMKFACSDTTPCTDIILKDISLRGNNDDVSSVETLCHSAFGITSGEIEPDAKCLVSDSDKYQKVEIAQTTMQEDDVIIHTEL